jgi:hypothetical protein
MGGGVDNGDHQFLKRLFDAQSVLRFPVGVGVQHLHDRRVQPAASMLFEHLLLADRVFRNGPGGLSHFQRDLIRNALLSAETGPGRAIMSEAWSRSTTCWDDPP